MEKLLPSSDFQLSSYLLAKGGRLIAIDRTNPKRCRFLFEKNATTECLIQEYWNKGTVIAMEYGLAQGELKRRLFSDIP